MSAYAVEKNHISREEANKQMDGLLAVMGLLDRIEVIQRGADRQFTLTLRVTTVQPLK